jgi:chemotaxis regulatin CheY-phosphate phosphatase CheZ
MALDTQNLCGEVIASVIRIQKAVNQRLRLVLDGSTIDG